MRISPTSVWFMLLLGLLAALPSFGIDTSLPALGAVGAALHVAPARAGLTMSVFMLGFAVTPLVYGPASDRYGRKPVVLFACLLFTFAAIGCATASSLSALLAWRFVQGAGAGASITVTLAMLRDVFDGRAARERLSYIMTTTMTVPMLAPTLGATLMALGGWRGIHAFLAGVGALLSFAMLLGLGETAPRGAARPLAAIVRDYVRVLTHPACRGYLLIAAATFGALFAYVSGSPLFLIGVWGFGTERYGLVFAATSLGIMAGSLLNGRISAMGVSYHYPLAVGLTVALLATTVLLAMAIGAWMPSMLVIPLLVLCNVSFGLVMPNAMERAMQPFPETAGVVGAAVGFLQMASGAAVSSLVALFYDGRTALSMTVLMTLCVLIAAASYLLLAYPSGRVVSLKSG